MVFNAHVFSPPWLNFPIYFILFDAIVNAFSFYERAFSSSPLSIMLGVGLSYKTFIMLKYIPSVPTLMSFYHEWVLTFVKCFFGSIGVVVWFLFFILLMWCGSQHLDADSLGAGPSDSSFLSMQIYFFQGKTGRRTFLVCCLCCGLSG